jgi:hypothetical protein
MMHPILWMRFRARRSQRGAPSRCCADKKELDFLMAVLACRKGNPFSSNASSKKAARTLLGLLNSEQRRNMAYRDYFDITSRSGEWYRVICSQCSYNVLAVSKIGTVKYGLCAVSSGTLPSYDIYLSQALTLQVNEYLFLRTANKSSVYSGKTVSRATELFIS